MIGGVSMKKQSIKKNFIYNSILTSANIVFPLITAPYLSYTLGAENIGKVNFATSLVNWFILISAFGIPRYGIREIARNRDNKKNLSNAFWNLILIQACLTIISIGLYLLVVFNVPRFENQLNIHLMMILMLVLNVFSIDWFYQGIEEYSYITIRNIAFKIISIILMFVMVKNSEDYIIYAGINIFGLCFNNILNYLHTKKYIDIIIYFSCIIRNITISSDFLALYILQYSINIFNKISTIYFFINFTFNTNFFVLVILSFFINVILK